MKIIAIDPGYDRLGFAVLEKKDGSETVLYSECFQTNKKQKFLDRLFEGVSRLGELIDIYEPRYCVIEGLFFSKNTKTALSVSEMRGALQYKALESGLEIYEFTPNQIKVAVTGYGLANKKDVYYMVQKIIPQYSLDNKKDDEIDAIAAGLTFFASYNTIKR